MNQKSIEEDVIQGFFDFKVLGRLIGYLKPYKKQVALAILLAAAVSAINVGLPIILKTTVDDYVLNDNLGIHQRRSGILNMSLLFFALLCFYFALNYIQVYLLNWTGQHTMADLRDQVFRHFQQLRMTFFDNNPIGRLVTRNTNDIQALNEMYSQVLIYFVKDLLTILGILAVCFFYSVHFGLFMTGVLLIILLATALFNWKVTPFYRAYRVILAKINSALAEYISGMRIIQLFHQEKRIKGQFTGLNDDFAGAWRSLAHINIIYRPFMGLLRFASMAMVLWFVGGRILANQLTLGELAAFLAYLERFFHPIFHMTERVDILKSAIASAERIFRLLDQKEFIDRPKTPVTPERFVPAIAFKDFWFSYDNKQWVLKDVSFSVAPGERVAIVGPTGAGKTSIISLVLRFYEYQRGDILLNGTSIRDLDLPFLKRHLSYVMQDVYLFSGSLRDNLLFGLSDVSDQHILEVCRRVQLDGLLATLPQGLDTPVKEGGRTFSYGEKQLISFARALLNDPELIILDEATANIDSRTEHLIQLAIEELLKGRTAVVIAHRLSTIQHSDKILVIHQGRLVEQGKHQELIERKGLYYKLYKLQTTNARPA